MTVTVVVFDGDNAKLDEVCRARFKDVPEAETWAKEAVTRSLFACAVITRQLTFLKVVRQ